MIKKMLKRREECDTYLTQFCRHQHSIREPSEKTKELAASVVVVVADESHSVG